MRVRIASALSFFHPSFLRALGLRVSGTKPELADRLLSALGLGGALPVPARLWAALLQERDPQGPGLSPKVGWGGMGKHPSCSEQQGADWGLAPALTPGVGWS